MNQTELSNFKRLATSYNLRIQDINKNFIQKYDDINKIYDDQAKFSGRKDIESKTLDETSQKLQSFLINTNKLDQSKLMSTTTNLFDIKPVFRSMKKAFTDIVTKRDQPISILNFTGKWNFFRDIIAGNQKIKMSFDNNLKILSKSIMQFSNIFVDVDNKEIRSFFVNNEDIIVKLLKFLEFWSQKGVSLEISKFIIKILR